MKKYFIVIVSLLLISAIVMVFQVPDRINYAFNKMGSYNLDKYTVSETPLEKNPNTIKLSMKTYTASVIPLVSDNNGNKVDITNIEYTGTGYRIYLTSTGTSSFDSGMIIILDNVTDFQFDSSCGLMNFQVSGKGSLTGNSIDYICDIYPVDDSKINALADLQCEFDLQGLTYRHFKRI